MDLQELSAITTPAMVLEWLTPTEICHELQIPLQTFYQWRSRGVGPDAYRIGKHLRVSKADFEAWLLLRSDP